MGINFHENVMDEKGTYRFVSDLYELNVIEKKVNTILARILYNLYLRLNAKKYMKAKLSSLKEIYFLPKNEEIFMFLMEDSFLSNNNLQG